MWRISKHPVPTWGTLPSTICEEGVASVSISLLVAAFVRNFTQVSKDILRKGLMLSSIQTRFIAFISPENVR